MKMLGKKKRSLSCLISSSSIAKDNCKFNQFLSGENTIVYALVEVSKDSEKPAKREKIPLNNKDLLKVIQKFMISQKLKPERKIIRLSKQKQVAESASVTVNMPKEEKSTQNDVPAHRGLGLSDETSLIYKRSNHSGIDRHKGKEKDCVRQKLHSGDHNTNESETQHVKILFNRNTLRNQETKIKEERIGPISRGTNTDIVQTPKVMEEALQRLTLDLEVERSNGNPNDKKNFCFSALDSGENVYKSVTPTTEKFLFVPFIITNNQISEDQRSQLLNFTDLKNDARKTNEFKADKSLALNNDPKQTCLTDSQTEVTLMNTDKISMISTDHMVKSGKEVDEKVETENKTNRNNAFEDDGETSLLKEVKILQQRINAIVEGLETNNFNNKKNVNDLLLNETLNVEEPNDQTVQDSTIKTMEETSLQNCIHYLDCGVQALLVKSCCDKTVTVPSETALKSLRNKFVQAPSEEIIKSPAKLAKLASCKSASLFRNKIEYSRIKRASSALAFSKRVEDSEYLESKKFNLNCEGSTPKEFHHDLKLELLKKKFNDESYKYEKITNILFKKSSLTCLADNEKDKSITIKQCGKIAKIKIVGNTTLLSENRDSGVGRIKLELNELGSIKISNKFSRKTRTIDSNSCCENSVNNSADSNLKVAYNNASNNLKCEERNKKAAGEENVSKIARRETLQKKVEIAKPAGNNPKNSPKDPNPPQPSPRVFKFKKPTKPVRMFSKAKEGGPDSSKPSKLQSPKDQPVVLKADENHLAKSPRPVKSAEKVNAKKNIGSLPNNQIPKNQCPRPVLTSQSDKIPDGSLRESEVGVSLEVPGKADIEASSLEKPPAIKAIWALTKIVLYEDGTQSFEVLEASSNPLQYQSNKVNGYNDCNSSNVVRKTNNVDYKDSSYLEEKSH